MTTSEGIMKKVLIIGLTDRIGGVETFIYNTTINSNKDKYEYDFLVHGASKCVYENEINNFYKESQHIFFIRKYKKNPIGCFIDLCKFYIKNGKKYDYIHLQTGATSEVLYVFPFCLFFRFKVISHSHNGNGYSPIINSIFRPILNFITYKRIACSEVAAKWLFGKKKSKNAIILNNGIDTERFKFNKKAREVIRQRYLVGDRLLIGHIGRFSEQKNHKFIIEIFEELLNQNINAQLMLVGVGELQEKIKKMCIDRNIIDRVTFAGIQSNTEEYYSAFDIFLMPSLYEGLPIVGIEAQSEGLQCLFSNNIDKQILITNRANMISLDEGKDYWAKEIKRLSSSIDENNRHEYANIVENNGYGIKSAIRILEELYEV